MRTQNSGEPLVRIDGIGGHWQLWTSCPTSSPPSATWSRSICPGSARRLSPIGFARGRERALTRMSLSASRATARLLDPAVDVAMRTGSAAR